MRTKKVTFDNLPTIVQQILETISVDKAGDSASPELSQQVARLEKRMENLERILSPERPTMNKQTVLKVLKLRAKALAELEAKGTLLSHKDGRSTVFYEDDVVKFYINQSSWKAAKAAAVEVAADEVDAPEIAPEIRQRIGIDEAAKLLDKAKGTMYHLTSSGKIPHHKEGRIVYFYTDELREWQKEYKGKKRRGTRK